METVEDVDASDADGRCPGLFRPWLTWGRSMWPRSADDCPGSIVTRRLSCLVVVEALILR